MTGEQFLDWMHENGTGESEHYYSNTVNYIFVAMRDGWTAVFERDGAQYIPVIQAADIEHAQSYCNLREPIRVPINLICAEEART